MIINIKTNRTIEEIENTLSNQILEKYPRRYSENRKGINWVSNKKDFLCLFYEDDNKDRFGCQTTAKPFFYGNYRIVGIACLNIVDILIILALLIISIFGADEFLEFDSETLFGLVFACFILAIFVNDLLIDTKKIKKYLIFQLNQMDLSEISNNKENNNNV